MLEKIRSAWDLSLFRIGGEEFLILSITEDIRGVAQFAEKLRATIADSPSQYQNLTINITMSAGICLIDAQQADQSILTHMLSEADKAMYQAKKNGRNQVCLATGLDSSPALRRV